jgi:predicted aspartyl protease/Skp family chaperone for outer membrane proteins
MKNHIKYVVLLMFLLASWPLDLRAEFYKYVDDEENIFYVDDLSRVPEKYRNQIKVYREKYDKLSEEERSRALERENEQLQEQAREQERQLNERLSQTQQIEEEESRKQADAARQKLREKTETRVILEGNRILIPVTFNNNGIEVEVNLLLDTGASQIVLNRKVADELNIVALNKGLAQVAGGANIYTELGKVSYVKVGPFKMKDAGVLIIAHEGAPVNYSGLLGMNFLKNVAYSIDYKNQVIRWELPQGAGESSN